MASVINLDDGVPDRTVRALPSELWVEINHSDLVYRGPDHSTLDGAVNLVKRLRQYWAERGVEVQYEVYPVRRWQEFPGDAVYGVRERKGSPQPNIVAAPPPLALEVGPTPRQRIKAVILDTIARDYPTVPYEVVMNNHRDAGKRPLLESEARRACIRAVAAAFPEMHQPRLASIFSVNHTSVCCALNEVRDAANKANARAQHMRRKELKVAA